MFLNTSPSNSKEFSCGHGPPQAKSLRRGPAFDHPFRDTSNQSRVSLYRNTPDASPALLFQDKQEREEEERKKRLQLYVFVLRCISYPFNAKQPNDLTKRYQKVTKQQLEVIQGRFQVRPRLSWVTGCREMI